MPEELGQFKSQPWVVFDTVAARSFLVGEDRSEFFAFGTNNPAINRRGELLFFTQGRTEANAPWYTSLELVGQLSYGFEAWQVYCHFGMPPWPANSDLSDSKPSGDDFAQSPPALLTQLIMNYGVLQLNLGQEQQLSFPVHRFGSGGGFYSTGSGGIVGQNGWPQAGNVLKLPEPIEIARTQNLDAKIRLAPEILEIIGFPPGGDAGVGCPIGDLLVNFQTDESKTDSNDVPTPPYTVQVGLIGRRIKKTQYGQVPNSPG